MFLIVLATLFSLPFGLAQTLSDEGLVAFYLFQERDRDGGVQSGALTFTKRCCF